MEWSSIYHFPALRTALETPAGNLTVMFYDGIKKRVKDAYVSKLPPKMENTVVSILVLLFPLVQCCEDGCSKVDYSEAGGEALSIFGLWSWVTSCLGVQLSTHLFKVLVYEP